MTTTDTTEDFAYSRPVTELVTIAAEYCKALEGQEFADAGRFNDIMRGLLPMVYLKMSLLPPIPDVMGYNESRVTEADYNYVRSRVKQILGADDDYLDVFVEDFKYSERPILRTVSEDLADVYQALRELVEAFRGGFAESILAGLHDAREQFELSWGQRVLNALKALHDIRFGTAAQADD